MAIPRPQSSWGRGVRAESGKAKAGNLAFSGVGMCAVRYGCMVVSHESFHEVGTLYYLYTYLSSLQFTNLSIAHDAHLAPF